MSAASMTSACFDLSTWPLVGIYVPRGLTAEGIPPLFAEWERICLERGPHLAALDLRDFNPLSAAGPIRRVAAREVARGMPAYRESLYGVARLVSHPLTRALLTAFDWMLPLPWPVLNTESTQAAGEWLRARGEASGLPLPPRVDLDALRAQERLLETSRAS